MLSSLRSNLRVEGYVSRPSFSRQVPSLLRIFSAPLASLALADLLLMAFRIQAKNDSFKCSSLAFFTF